MSCGRVTKCHHVCAERDIKGMDFKLDVKLKANGQAGTAWFKASVVNELVRGSMKVPGGLAPWMSSLLFFVGEDFLAKQTANQWSRGLGRLTAT